MSLRPLAGLRVVEIGSDVAAAFGARLLANLGADVVKVEPAAGGDPARRMEPFAVPASAEDSALFGYLNYDKKSVGIDAGSTEGQKVLRDLVAWSDIVIASPDAPGASALPPAVAALAPASRPVTVCVTPHGIVGPRATQPSSPYVVQHAAGFAYHQACPVTDPARTPPMACADWEGTLAAGIVVANAALWAMSEIVPGQPAPQVDFAAEDFFSYLLVEPFGDWRAGIAPPGRQRDPAKPTMVAGGLVWLLQCADGAIMVSPREDHQWARWLEVMGHPDWSADAALCGDRAIRAAHAVAIGEKMSAWAATQRRADVFARAQEERVACFPVSNAADMVANAQLAAREFYSALQVAPGATVPVPGLPFLMRATTGATLARGHAVAAPALGEAKAAVPAAAGARRKWRPFRLSGVRVVDFSWVMAGPMATKMLGGMGAEIIKIESSTRPEFSQRGGMYGGVNRNKKSCTLNIASAEGQALLRRLVAESDVVVENFSGRVLQKYGLAYADLAKARPDIVFVSASGLGRTGPQRDALAYGSLLQGYSGRVSMLGTLNPGLEAMGILPAWTDPMTALWEVLAVLAGLWHRAQTGEGMVVDLSMLESTVALLPGALLRAALHQPPAETGSDSEPGAAPSGCFPCAGCDSWLALSVRTDDEWRALCEMMGEQALAATGAWASHDGRLRHKADVNRRVAAWLATQPAAAAEAKLLGAGIAAARSRAIAEVAVDPHLVLRGAFRTVADGVEQAPLPWRDARGWRGESSPAPALGADNGYVFGELLGLGSDEQKALRDAGVIA